MKAVIDLRDSTLQVAIGQLSDTWKQAAATALNLTAEDALAVVSRKMAANFHLRVSSFDLPNKMIRPGIRATPNRLFVPITLGDGDDAPTKVAPGARRVQIFSKFGVAQTKTGSTSQPIAIPTEEIRPNIMDLVPRALYPKNQRNVARLMPGQGGLVTLAPKAAGTKRRQTIAVGGLRLHQQDRTFVMPNSIGTPRWGVWERFGPGKKDIRLDWEFKTQIAIPKRMNFEDDTRAVVAERWSINFAGAFERSLAGTLWRKAR